jgi:hypothetical protein
VYRSTFAPNWPLDIIYEEFSQPDSEWKVPDDDNKEDNNNNNADPDDDDDDDDLNNQDENSQVVSQLSKEQVVTKKEHIHAQEEGKHNAEDPSDG